MGILQHNIFAPRTAFTASRIARPARSQPKLWRSMRAGLLLKKGHHGGRGKGEKHSPALRKKDSQSRLKVDLTILYNGERALSRYSYKANPRQDVENDKNYLALVEGDDETKLWRKSRGLVQIAGLWQLPTSVHCCRPFQPFHFSVSACISTICTSQHKI